MADTGFVRFSTVDSSDGFDKLGTSPSNLIAPNTGEANENFSNKQVTLSGLNLNIPAGSTINGIEYKFTAKYASIGLNYKVSSSLFLGETQGTIHENRPGSGNDPLSVAFQDFTYGSSTTTEGLTELTTSNIENLKFKIQTGTVMQVTSLIVEGNSESPAIKVYYTEPEPVPSELKILPGPNFMSSNVDLTKFNGLGDKTSPLAFPPSSEDLFGFTSTIVPEGDNSSQATNSVFGDAANFGKLGLNRGGGTGISSDTGLLDTSKAPLSVRKGFRGL